MFICFNFLFYVMLPLLILSISFYLFIFLCAYLYPFFFLLMYQRYITNIIEQLRCPNISMNYSLYNIMVSEWIFSRKYPAQVDWRRKTQSTIQKLNFLYVLGRSSCLNPTIIARGNVEFSCFSSCCPGRLNEV